MASYSCGNSWTVGKSALGQQQHHPGPQFPINRHLKVMWDGQGDMHMHLSAKSRSGRGSECHNSQMFCPWRKIRHNLGKCQMIRKCPFPHKDKPNPNN